MLSKAPDTGFLNWRIEDTATLIQELKEKIPFVRFKKTKRMVCSLGVSYPYSGQVTEGHPWETYPPLLDILNTLNNKLGTSYNSVLLNWYPKDTYVGIGAHADDERELIPNQPVASVSLGQAVEFIIEAKYSDEKITVPLHDGDVFIMGEQCQKYYRHSVPYCLMPEDRISLTFREFKVNE